MTYLKKGGHALNFGFLTNFICSLLALQYSVKRPWLDLQSSTLYTAYEPKLKHILGSINFHGISDTENYLARLIIKRILN